MKILVVFTGGTIGSHQKDGWISTHYATKYELIMRYKELTKDHETSFESLSPYTILSENLSAEELNKLVDCTAENIEKDYDGIIVTHGTDTLQYTAAALSFLFSKCKKPIVLVSAAYPLENPKTNGVENFLGAVKFIEKYKGSGVFVSYKNEGDEKINILKAGRLLAHQENSADIYSIDKRAVASFSEVFCEVNNPESNSELSSKTIDYKKVRFQKNSSVLAIESRPGDDFSYNLEGKKAVILSPYHSATLNTENLEFKRFCEEAKKKNIPLFLVNQKGGITYKSSEKFSSLGIEVLPFCTVISAYMKAWLGASCGENLMEFMRTPISDEFEN